MVNIAMKSKTSKRNRAGMSGQFKGKLLCWDLENTLGTFGKTKAIARCSDMRNLTGIEDLLRPGIRSVLEELHAKGAAFALTTQASKDYASVCIKRAGIAGMFSRRYYGLGRSIKQKDFSDAYRDFGLHSMDSRMQNALSIGNSGNDFPAESVGIFEYYAMTYHAVVTLRIIEALFHEGNGNFMAGFEKLQSLGREAKEGPLLKGIINPPKNAKNLEMDGFDAMLFRIKISRTEHSIVTVSEVSDTLMHEPEVIR